MRELGLERNARRGAKPQRKKKKTGISFSLFSATFAALRELVLETMHAEAQSRRGIKTGMSFSLFSATFAALRALVLERNARRGATPQREKKKTGMSFSLFSAISAALRALFFKKMHAEAQSRKGKKTGMSFALFLIFASWIAKKKAIENQRIALDF
ncbi:MAG: hypothetical protein U5R06_04320 [candidate division KSB1 bacterium]|nr:hypothetical protein [candidate division KSB1 bacterium]